MKRKLILILLAILGGLVTGSASALFLRSLGRVTEIRQHSPQILFALPLAGLFIGWCFFRFLKDCEASSSLVIDEIHQPQKQLPLLMAPLVLGGTLVTHLFGGSAGREGTAVQMGAVLCDKISRIFKVTPEERRRLVVSGMAAGFGSAIGAPWAGAIFGLEVLTVGKVHAFALIEALIASFVAYKTVGLWGVAHTEYFKPLVPTLDLHLLVAIVLASLGFGFSARIFSLAIHFVEHHARQWIRRPVLRPFIGGIALVILFSLLGTYRYCGLGLEIIQDALQGNSLPSDPIYKTIFTSLTVGTGFKGGEFIPLVFIGSTLGHWFEMGLQVGTGFLSALGFAAVFGAAANTPLACAIMGTEIFGAAFAPYMLIACTISFFCSGQRGIYKTQRGLARKTFSHHRSVVRRAFTRL